MYFPDEQAYPKVVPHAAAAASHEQAAYWAWVVFLSPSLVTAFRTSERGLEVHGPVPRAHVPAAPAGRAARGGV